jgi:hypothetical protein
MFISLLLARRTFKAKNGNLSLEVHWQPIEVHALTPLLIFFIPVTPRWSLGRIPNF